MTTQPVPQLNFTNNPKVSQPLRDRPRSAESYSSSRRGNDEGGTGSNLNPFGLSEEPVSPAAPRANGRGHKAAPHGPRPSFFRRPVGCMWCVSETT